MRRIEAQHEHRCAAAHDSGESFARCAWPGAEVWGAGVYAVVARCASDRLYADPYPVARVTLCPDPMSAQQAAKMWDGHGCGLAVCTGSHRVTSLAVGVTT